MARQILDVSSISPRDYILASAHYFRLLRGDTDKNLTLKRRGFTEEQIRSATKNVVQPETKIMNLVFTVPLTNFRYSLMGYALTLLENYERGNLPFPGSVSEQPAQVMDLISVLQSVKQEFLNQSTVQQAPPKNSKKTKR